MPGQLKRVVFRRFFAETLQPLHHVDGHGTGGGVESDNDDDFDGISPVFKIGAVKELLTKGERITRPVPSITIPAAIQELEELARWCDNLSRVAS